MKKLPAITFFIALTVALGLYLYNPASETTPKVEKAVIEDSLETLLAIQEPETDPEPDHEPEILIQKETDLSFPSVITREVDKQEFISQLSTLIDPSIIYDPAYLSLSYPDGDVPAHTGVCSDVVIRAFKKVGVSLQLEIKVFRTSNGQSIDTNIDHRRVRNLGPYFASLGMEVDSGDYEAGDIIWWKLSGGIDHVGIVLENGRVLHNIGGGQIDDASPETYAVHKVYRLK